MPLGDYRKLDIQRLMQERPNGRPCVHPFTTRGLTHTTTPTHLGLVITAHYRCPDCDEHVDTIRVPLRNMKQGCQ